MRFEKGSVSRYLLIFGLMVTVGFYYVSRPDKPNTCDDWVKSYRDNKETYLVLKSVYKNGAPTTLYGTDPTTGQFVEFTDGSGWLGDIKDQFKPGDTVIKIKGHYSTIIKRKGKTIVLPMKCEGKIYGDK